MKIIYVHQLFKTPEEGGGIRSYYLARALVDVGHEVHMIASHASKSGLRQVDGISVHYQKIAYDNSFGFFKRIWAYGLFVLKAKKAARRIGRADLAYVMTTPLTTGWIAVWLKRKLCVPYFFEVGDLWPDVPVEMGAIKNPLLKKWLFSKEKEFYNEADKVIAMSPPQVEHIQSKTSTPIELIPNMADTHFFKPSFRSREVSMDNPLKILYCGTHGRANQLEFLIEAARESQDLPVRFSLMGEGSEKSRIIKLADGFKNVKFINHGSKKDVRKQLNEHDAVYLSFQNLPVLHTGCPNKFFDALASGKMIFSNLGSWLAKLIEEKRIGFAYFGPNPSEFKSYVEKYLTFENIQKTQHAAFELSKEFSRIKLSTKFQTCIETRC